MSDIKLTTADSAGFIPQYWAQRALDVLRSNIVLAPVCARDTNFGEVGWKGKSITVPYPGTFSAVDKVADTPATPQVPSGGSSVTLTLSKHKIVPFLIEDFANAQADMSLMTRYIQPAVIALAQQFETDLFAQYPNYTGTATTNAGTDLTAANVRTAMTSLDNALAPIQDRFMVISPKDKASLLSDTNLATYFAFSQANSIRNGYVGDLYGFTTLMSQLVPKGYQVGVGDSTGGTFTLTFNGQNTGALAYNADGPTTIQTAITGLSTVGAGNATVSTGTGPTWQVNFIGALAGTTLALTGSGSSLTGGAHTLTITTATKDLAFQKDALMYAVRPFPETPSNMGVMTAQANDPESGLSLRISAQYDVNNVGVRANIDLLYGIVALRPTLASVITT